MTFLEKQQLKSYKCNYLEISSRFSFQKKNKKGFARTYFTTDAVNQAEPLYQHRTNQLVREFHGELYSYQ